MEPFHLAGGQSCWGWELDSRVSKGRACYRIPVSKVPLVACSAGWWAEGWGQARDGCSNMLGLLSESYLRLQDFVGFIYASTVQHLIMTHAVWYLTTTVYVSANLPLRHFGVSEVPGYWSVLAMRHFRKKLTLYNTCHWGTFFISLEAIISCSTQTRQPMPSVKKTLDKKPPGRKTAREVKLAGVAPKIWFFALWINTIIQDTGASFMAALT